MPLVTAVKGFFTGIPKKLALIVMSLSMSLGFIYWIYDIGYTNGFAAGEKQGVSSCSTAQVELDNEVESTDEVLTAIADDAAVTESTVEELDDAATAAIVDTIVNQPEPKPEEQPRPVECFNVTELDLLNDIITGKIVEEDKQ